MFQDISTGGEHDKGDDVANTGSHKNTNELQSSGYDPGTTRPMLLYGDKNDSKSSKRESVNKVRRNFRKQRLKLRQQIERFRGSKKLKRGPKAEQLDYIDINESSHDSLSVKVKYNSKRRAQLMKEIALGHRVSQIMEEKEKFKAAIDADRKKEWKVEEKSKFIL